MLVIEARLKSKEIQRLLRPKEAAEGCRMSRWWLPGTKFGLIMMRMASPQSTCTDADPQVDLDVASTGVPCPGVGVDQVKQLQRQAGHLSSVTVPDTLRCAWRDRGRVTV